MFKKTILMSVLTLILGATQLQAQDSLKILNSFIQIELDSVSSHNLPANANPNSMSSLSFCVKVIALFSDTSNIDSIHIKVGRSQGSDNVANVSFAYNGGNISPALPEFVANQEGFCICVAPSVHNAYRLHLEIWADDKQGNRTPSYQMQVN